MGGAQKTQQLAQQYSSTGTSLFSGEEKKASVALDSGEICWSYMLVPSPAFFVVVLCCCLLIDGFLQCSPVDRNLRSNLIYATNSCTYPLLSGSYSLSDELPADMRRRRSPFSQSKGLDYSNGSERHDTRQQERYPLLTPPACLPLRNCGEGNNSKINFQNPWMSVVGEQHLK